MKTILAVFLFFSYSAYAQETQRIFAFLNKKSVKINTSKEEEQRIMDGHLSNIRRLAAEGKLILAGPFEGGGGILIFKSGSVEETRAWLDTDPGIRAKRWDVELFPYTSRTGTFCPVTGKIEMVALEFVRYITNVTKYNVQNAPETARRHEEYVRKIAETGNVVQEGVFGEDGGILILKGDLQKDVIESDPSLLEGLFVVEYKKLYVAKGAFCEN